MKITYDPAKRAFTLRAGGSGNAVSTTARWSAGSGAGAPRRGRIIAMMKADGWEEARAWERHGEG